MKQRGNLNNLQQNNKWRTPIRKVSKKQASIKSKLTAVYKEIDCERDMICQGCELGGLPVSHSHTISQKRCKEIGKPELIYDAANIELECFGESVNCHETWEHGAIWQKMRMKNFERKMEYIQKNDPEQFTKLQMQIDEYEYHVNQRTVR